MSMTNTTEPLRILKEKKTLPLRATECPTYFLHLRRDRISKTILEKELCDHDNYFWRETNSSSNLIACNVGCKKRKKVRKERKWKPSTGIPRRSPIQLRTPSDRLTSVFDENQCVPYGMVGQGKGAKLLFGF